MPRLAGSAVGGNRQVDWDFVSTPSGTGRSPCRSNRRRECDRGAVWRSGAALRGKRRRTAAVDDAARGSAASRVPRGFGVRPVLWRFWAGDGIALLLRLGLGPVRLLRLSAIKCAHLRTKGGDELPPRLSARCTAGIRTRRSHPILRFRRQSFSFGLYEAVCVAHETHETHE